MTIYSLDHCCGWVHSDYQEMVHLFHYPIVHQPIKSTRTFHIFPWSFTGCQIVFLAKLYEIHELLHIGQQPTQSKRGDSLFYSRVPWPQTWCQFSSQPLHTWLQAAAVCTEGLGLSATGQSQIKVGTGMVRHSPPARPHPMLKRKKIHWWMILMIIFPHWSRFQIMSQTLHAGNHHNVLAQQWPNTNQRACQINTISAVQFQPDLLDVMYPLNACHFTVQ